MDCVDLKNCGKSKWCGKTTDLNENIWIFGDLRHFNGDVWIVNDTQKAKVEPDSVGWYIGKQDKDGQDIYTGDLVEIEQTVRVGDTTHTVNQTYRVTYSDEMACVVVDMGAEGFVPLYRALMPGDVSIMVIGKVFEEEQFDELR